MSFWAGNRQPDLATLAAAVRQREIEVSSRGARRSFSESALFSERLTVPPRICDR